MVNMRQCAYYFQMKKKNQKTNKYEQEVKVLLLQILGL